MNTNHRHLRRGGSYVAVLAVAMIVSVIGLSALMATRVQARSAENARDVLSARLYGEAGVEMGLRAIVDDLNWRSNYTNDTWETRQAIGTGSFTFKLVDQRSASLTADPNSPVRLYGMGMADDAVRIYSVLLEPLDGAASNLINNPGFEDGVTDWTVIPGDCVLSTDASDPHSGKSHLCVRLRSGRGSGPLQYVTSRIVKGTTYDTEVWVQMTGSPETVIIKLWVQTAFTWTSYTAASGTADVTWTRISGQITPTWFGTATSVYWTVQTGSTNQDFEIDDVELREPGDITTVAPVAGTWRRELN